MPIPILGAALGLARRAAPAVLSRAAGVVSSIGKRIMGARKPPSAPMGTPPFVPSAPRPVYSPRIVNVGSPPPPPPPPLTTAGPRLVPKGTGGFTGLIAGAARRIAPYAAPIATVEAVRGLTQQVPGRDGTRVKRAYRPDPRTGVQLEPGRALTEATDRFGRPLLREGGIIERIYCPTGYVAVVMPDGSTACALKGPARAAGLWTGRRKPPISAGDWRKLVVADRVKKTARRIARMAGVTKSARCPPGRKRK